MASRLSGLSKIFNRSPKLGPKGGARATRREAAKKRLNRMNRKKMFRRALEGGLQGGGFDVDRMSQSKTPSGKMLRQMGIGAPGSDFDVTLPPLETPSRASNESQPEISTLVEQLKKLIDTAKKIGITTKEQQEQLVKQVKSAEAISKEQQTEIAATPVTSAESGDDIQPARSAVDDLIKAINELDQNIDDKIRQAQQPNSTGDRALRGALNAGGFDTDFLDERQKKLKSPQMRKGFTRLPGGQFRGPDGKIVKPEAALKNFKQVDPKFLNKTAKLRQAEALTKPGIFGRALGGLKNIGRGAIGGAVGAASNVATKVAGSGLAGRVVNAGLGAVNTVRGTIGGAVTRVAGSNLAGRVVNIGLNATNIVKGAAATTAAGVKTAGSTIVRRVGSLGTKTADIIKKGVSSLGGAAATKVGGAKLAGNALKAQIAKIAKPLVTKAVAKTGLKSIPIVGALAGGLFAIGRLLQGDVVGAGLEAASGLAGPLTAIPALVLSLARDVYTGVFSQHPETDPLMPERMAAVKGGVEALVKESLSQKVETEDKSTTSAPSQVAAPPPSTGLGSTNAGGSSTSGGGATTGSSDSLPVSGASLSSAGMGGGGSGGGSTASGSGEGGSGGGSSASGSGGGSSASGSGGESGAALSSASTSAAGGSTTGASEGGAPDAAAMSNPSTTGQSLADAPTTSDMPAQSQSITPVDSGANIKPESPSGYRSGAIIAAASSSSMSSSPGSMGGGGSIPTPSTIPSSRSNVTGMGNVPEPTYMGAGDLIKGIYFGSVAGAMA